MQEVEEKLTLQGFIVLTLGVNTKDVARYKELEQYKPMLDKLHLYKIDLCDEIYVVNVNGYIGKSTIKEIVYANLYDKPIKYLEPVKLPD
jgi:hypothetical protein